MSRIIEKEIREAIQDLALDLHGFTVLTEAASGIFAYTPLIALAAGAKVYAVGRDSRYGTLAENERDIQALAQQLALPTDNLSIVHRDAIGPFLREIDIVTNLGFVRPIDEPFVASLKSGAVISYMCEAWEHRKADLDLEVCKRHGIPVYGINEEHPSVNCFRETGLIALQLVFESKVSVCDAKILVISRDKFGIEIGQTLRQYTPYVTVISDFGASIADYCDGLDLVIVADYLFEGTVIGCRGLLDPSLLKAKSPSVQIIQYCGHNAVDEIKEAGLTVYPDVVLAPVRMVRTLADISSKAMIRLHAGGLKVGALAARRDLEPHNEMGNLIQVMENVHI